MPQIELLEISIIGEPTDEGILFTVKFFDMHVGHGFGP